LTGRDWRKTGGEKAQIVAKDLSKSTGKKPRSMSRRKRWGEEGTNEFGATGR